jgi:hypothetical protein
MDDDSIIHFYHGAAGKSSREALVRRAGLRYSPLDTVISCFLGYGLNCSSERPIKTGALWLEIVDESVSP